MNKFIYCPHCGGTIKISNFILESDPFDWHEIKVPDNENVIYVCDECKKEVKEGYIKYPIEYSNYPEYSKSLLHSQPKPYFYCKCCARKNGVERQYLFERHLLT